MPINQKIKLLLELSGFSQSELASKIGVTFAAFNRWLNNKAAPRKNAIQRIDSLLGKYGVKTDQKISFLSAKKLAIEKLRQKNKNILGKILARGDLIDELSLQITYNSNAIEGSTLSEKETREIIFDGRALSRPTLNEQLEAKNHHKAFLFLLSYLKAVGKIKEKLAKDLHKILLAGIKEDAGNYRRQPVRILGSFVPTANYLKVPELIKKLFTRKNKKEKLDFAVHFHVDFEKIHPFSDGNGRTGRLLLIGMLLQENIAPPIISKKKRAGYYKALQEAQLAENYEPILECVCDAILRGYKIIEG